MVFRFNAQNSSSIFDWLFSTVYFDMSAQRAWVSACKVALVAFVWLVSTVHYQMCLQMVCPRGCKITQVCLTFLHCAFSNVSSNCLQQKRHIHIGCIFLKYWHHLLFSSGFFLLHPLNQGHKFQFVPLSLCVVFCPNGCFKLSLNCNKVKFFFAYFHFLATHQQTINDDHHNPTLLPSGSRKTGGR